jgi:hypothetical protein
MAEVFDSLSDASLFVNPVGTVFEVSADPENPRYSANFAHLDSFSAYYEVELTI